MLSTSLEGLLGEGERGGRGSQVCDGSVLKRGSSPLFLNPHVKLSCVFQTSLCKPNCPLSCSGSCKTRSEDRKIIARDFFES